MDTDRLILIVLSPMPCALLLNLLNPPGRNSVPLFWDCRGLDPTLKLYQDLRFCTDDH